MPLYRDEAVVLRTAKLGEADRIITMLTRSHGKIRAVAKGARKVRSRFGARLEPFMRVDVLVASGRSLDVVSQAESVAAYAAPIVADYDAYVAANVIVETIDRLVPAEHERVPAQYRLLIGALNALAKHAHAPEAIGDSYVMRALALAGWTPRLVSCVVCGEPVGTPAWMSVASGGVMCDRDHTPDAHRTEPAVLRQFAALVRGDWDVLDGGSGGAMPGTVGTDANVGAGVNAGPLLPATRRLVEEWSEYYMERPIRSLRLLD
ncbi:DNA repair protein RecO [Bifidobacterium amazonense]|uniref:DNA repair protein RecO n=1 Tax=Bifidobacterium amazonense TaxID=2809027 RepID=A0ABS9VSN0_9BIFI|nr:DNA repair protein RecO [Bifidobacterium amazonense]MCH9274931.1 DNA repair protein RecO [Bifidobacterium amazonense]